MHHISRNAPCTCGSGKRYKHCHGATSLRSPPAGHISSIADDKFTHALNLHKAGKLVEAELIYTKLLEAQPANPQVLLYLGVINYQRKDFEDAEKYIRSALRIDSAIPMGYHNLALVLRGQRKLLEALACCDKAIEQDPCNAASHSNRGMVLAELYRLEESLVSCDEAIRLKPDFVEAHLNRGKTLSLLKRHEESLANYDKVIALKPDCAEAYSNRGTSLVELNRDEEAISSFQQALALVPAMPNIIGMWVFAKMRCCIWNTFDDDCTKLLNAIAMNEKAPDPFVILALPSTPAQQQHCARMAIPAGSHRLWDGEVYKHERIRIGYLSADFRNHPMAQLLAELIERHDRSKFELIGISFGPNTRDSWRLRLEQAFDRFYDVHNQSNAQIAALVREQEIDIAIDLMGHTRDARGGVFALRPAPIQVNYMGYPGTTGAEYIDYIIADKILIPPEHQQYYDEKVVYLPHTYQANDSTKRISDRRFSRAELGLPEHAFVFCCFNNTFKITPDLFDIWMRLLHSVDRSVLWLYGSNPSAMRNLKIEANKRGVAPERLVFAPRMELDEHLARHRQADLFLDTFYYNAHTTASDALWAGLPVLTCEGGAFAGRVASSLLNAVWLPELITRNHAEYESMALQLATCPGRLDAIRNKLAMNKTSLPLFDTALFTKHIETAYQLMFMRHKNGMPPDHITVPPNTP